MLASRLTAREEQWRLYEGVELEPRSEGTLVHAPWFVEPVLLQDLVELQPGNASWFGGRSSDMIEVAGKRASLSDITRRLRLSQVWRKQRYSSRVRGGRDHTTSRRVVVAPTGRRRCWISSRPAWTARFCRDLC